jgi:hypothetical protein
MRIRVVQRPTTRVVDGIDLKHFEPGEKYDVGTGLGTLMLAEGWAEPVDGDEVLPAPFSDADPYTPRVIDRNSPPNLIRETYPPYADAIATATDFDRRRRRRSLKSAQN